MTKIAIIRVRGGIRVNTDISDTMNMLRLYNQHNCVIYEKTQAIVGMVEKIKDYVAWGEIDDETIQLIAEKRGEKHPKDDKKLKSFFRLSPPRGGFERKGIKKGYNAGGALGYRGEKIKELILKMV